VTDHLVRSFLLGRTMGEAVQQEREETISELIAQDLMIAPLALRLGAGASIREYLSLRDDMSRKRLNGQRERLAVIIRRRIVGAIAEEEVEAERAAH
jgi:hypothetical protein